MVGDVYHHNFQVNISPITYVPDLFKMRQRFFDMLCVAHVSKYLRICTLLCLPAFGMFDKLAANAEFSVHPRYLTVPLINICTSV